MNELKQYVLEKFGSVYKYETTSALPTTTIYRVLNGDNVPQLETAFVMATELELPIEELARMIKNEI